MKMKIALGADHAGFEAKTKMAKYLSTLGYTIVDVGAFTEEPSDYPDYSFQVAKAVASGRCDRGLLFCGSGIGMCIAANKVKGIRAATPWSVETAKLSAQHNWANVLCVPARFLTLAMLKKVIKAWLDTPFETGGRHERRVKKIQKIESKSAPSPLLTSC